LHFEKNTSRNSILRPPKWFALAGFGLGPAAFLKKEEPHPHLALCFRGKRDRGEPLMLNVSIRPQPAAIAAVSALAGTAGETSSDEILDATYGGNCAGIVKGNVTRFVASTCDGSDLCNYRVYYKNMGGDPAPDCEKAFRVTYICGKNSKPETCALEAEAGKGGENGQSNHFCLLHCLPEGRSGADRARRKMRSGQDQR
jgi:hypothetical protein